MRSPAPQRTDLAIAAALSLLSMFVIALPTSGWVQAGAGALLVLALPGYAITVAIFLPGDIRSDVRAALSVVLSIACVALGGLLVQIVFRLDRALFAGLVLAVTGLCLAVAARRRTSARREAPRQPIRLPLPGLPAILALLLAIGMTGSAIAIAIAGQHRQFANEHFTALSMLPAAPRGADPPQAPLRVSVANHEGRRVLYGLRVQQGSRLLEHWHIDLPASHQWSAILPPPNPASKAPVVAQLFRGGSLYRRVALRPESGE